MIITLCGSARFEKEFKEANEALTLQGHTVFSLAVYPSDKEGKKDWYTPEQKVALDAAHLRKIDASEAIFVVGDGYIGESTRREIEHAHKTGKLILSPFPHYSEKGFTRVCPFRPGCGDRLRQPPCGLCYE